LSSQTRERRLRFRFNRRFVHAMIVGVLAVALPVLGQSPPPFEFFAVSGSNNDLPSEIAGTSALEDSLNIQVCDEFGKGRAPNGIARKLHLMPSEL
jgi:hypothetical protein